MKSELELVGEALDSGWLIGEAYSVTKKHGELVYIKIFYQIFCEGFEVNQVVILRLSEGKHTMHRIGLIVILIFALNIVRFPNGENCGIVIKSSADRNRKMFANMDVEMKEIASETEIFTSALFASVILFGPCIEDCAADSCIPPNFCIAFDSLFRRKTTIIFVTPIMRSGKRNWKKIVDTL